MLRVSPDNQVQDTFRVVEFSGSTEKLSIRSEQRGCVKDGVVVAQELIYAVIFEDSPFVSHCFKERGLNDLRMRGTLEKGAFIVYVWPKLCD